MNTMNNTIAVKALGLQQTWPPASLLRVNPLAAVVVAGMLALLCLQACTSENKLLVGITHSVLSTGDGVAADKVHRLKLSSA